MAITSSVQYFKWLEGMRQLATLHRRNKPGKFCFALAKFFRLSPKATTLQNLWKKDIGCQFSQSFLYRFLITRKNVKTGPYGKMGQHMRSLVLVSNFVWCLFHESWKLNAKAKLTSGHGLRHLAWESVEIIPGGKRRHLAYLSLSGCWRYSANGRSQKPYINVDLLRKIYFSIVYCHLYYAILIWGIANKTLLGSLAKLNHQAIRTVCKIHNNEQISIKDMHLLYLYSRDK